MPLNRIITEVCLWSMEKILLMARLIFQDGIYCVESLAVSRQKPTRGKTAGTGLEPTSCGMQY